MVYIHNIIQEDHVGRLNLLPLVIDIRGRRSMSSLG